MSVDQRLEGILSPFLHYGLYKVRKPEIQLEIGMLITSIDIDVGIEMLGAVNGGKYDENVRGKLFNGPGTECAIGKIEEQALPLIVAFFNELQIPVTFALRGQLFEVDDSILNLIVRSSVEHEIASHSYYHSDFTKLSRNKADNELRLLSEGMRDHRITPKTFIFPRNKVNHLDLLEKYGYKCYRDYGTSHPYFMQDGMYIKKHGRLFDVHPSLYFGSCAHRRNVKLIQKTLDICIEKRLPFHLWFHLWDLGLDSKSIINKIKNVFFPLFSYAKSKAKRGSLSIETMISAVEKMESAKS